MSTSSHIHQQNSRDLSLVSGSANSDLSSFDQETQQNSLIQSLKDWSNVDNYTIIYDSDINGDRSRENFLKAVLNKSNLYFITRDNKNNVFGGYLNVKAKEVDKYITDHDIFVFSLIRNTKNFDHVFRLNSFHYLYRFGGGYGGDIMMSGLFGYASWCNPHSFEYNNEKDPLSVSDTHQFYADRYIVIEMDKKSTQQHFLDSEYHKRNIYEQYEDIFWKNISLLQSILINESGNNT
ncbi:TLDc domain-containing protein [Entamoeba marina]